MLYSEEMESSTYWKEKRMEACCQIAMGIHGEAFNEEAE